MEEAPAKRNPAASLTDDLLVEILRRLPIRSVCRFKCVSRSWRNLISDPAHRKKLPQTLAGFFYCSLSGERFPVKAHHFTNVTGKGIPFIFPSFSFLPVPSDDVVLLDCCNDLLLCRCYEPDPHNGDESDESGPSDGDGFRPFHYVVCNPATKKWVMLPDGSWASGETRTTRLAFDPAVSSQFHVVQYVVDEAWCVTGVEIYSSKTAAWSFKESEWGDDVMLHHQVRSVFLNGFLHMLTVLDGIALVDMDAKTWRTIPVPTDNFFDGCIHQAQGRLCFLNVDDADFFKLSIWFLEDHGTNEWTLKHSVRTPLLFGRKKLRFEFDYTVITIHPECNLIYFVYGWDKTLMAYEMDRKEVRVIRNLGHDCSVTYFPYVPLFLEALEDEQ
ncbi:F-box protein At5g07610-like isoform X2 [Panicum virgatum]|nr:F-box protein At5g07610-like isoform X2 [Panicum virgatum]